MITRAGDIYCEQGESFTVGFRIVNPDGSPFVLSDALDDATHKSYLLFTVASSANVTGKSRYLSNHWNPTDKYKKFYSTQAIKLADNDGEWKEAATVWTDVQDIIDADKSLNGVTTKPTPANYAIYYIVKSDGTKDYKQLTGTQAEPSLEPYSFYFFQQFTKEQSIKWTQSGYDYALKVVAGSVKPEGSARLIDIDFSYPLIGVHKLYVDSNVQGSIEDVEVVNE
nr:MAG TPA: hypothetical protein [Caudoviricetes sp.]